MIGIIEKTQRYVNINDPLVHAKLEMLNMTPRPSIITTSEHKVVWYNKAFYETYAKRVPDIENPTISLMLGCKGHSKDEEFSYNEYCDDCPLRHAFVGLENGAENVQRGVITIPVPWGKAELNIEVSANYITLGGQKLILFSIRDLESEVTRYQLNRAFFHDLLNVGQQLRSSINLSQMILEDAKNDNYRVPTQINKELELMSNSLNTITDMVNAQRQLNNAQNSTLMPYMVEFRPEELLQDLPSTTRRLDENGGRLLVLVPCQPNLVCQGDRILLQQVCYGMLHTLIFSSRAEQIIELGYTPDGDNLIFWFRNRELHLNENKLKQFLTDYSLKRTRNVHSYTIALLAERYIKGKVDITSNEENGTTISLAAPLHPRVQLPEEAPILS